MAKCELNCQECRIKNCGMRTMNAFENLPEIKESVLMVGLPQEKVHPKVDARRATKNLRGTSGGTYGGVPPAEQVSPELYAVDVLKAEKNRQ